MMQTDGMRRPAPRSLRARIGLLVATSAMLVSISGCRTLPASEGGSADQTRLRENESAWVADWSSKNADRIAGHYADDAVLMAPGMTAMQGKDAIRNGLRGMVGDPNLTLTFAAQRVEVSKSGDLGYTQGSYQMTMSNPKTHQPVHDKGSYVTVYRKQSDGSWKAVSDIATSEMPMP